MLFRSDSRHPISIDDWIEVVNTGYVDSHSSRLINQVNITGQSEAAIQLGRTDCPTVLEDAPSSGLYLRVTCNQEHWLLPTQRTLAGFTTHQPKKGIHKGLFGYCYRSTEDDKREPEVWRAARLEQTDEGWVVMAPGVILVADGTDIIVAPSTNPLSPPQSAEDHHPNSLHVAQGLSTLPPTTQSLVADVRASLQRLNDPN